MIVILWLVYANLWVRSAAPSVINVEAGRDVTLVPNFSGDPSEINWKIDGNKLVDMELKPRVDIAFYVLRDRATISPSDGRLTIKDLTVGDSGVYKAEVLVNNVIQATEIRLNVSDASNGEITESPKNQDERIARGGMKWSDPAVTTISSRPGTPSTKPNDQPKAEEGQSGLSAGHMTGIVIGGIALVVIAVAGIVICEYRIISTLRIIQSNIYSIYCS
ncbi:uncharacterized protein LOC143981499 [Lithobates pipiens]